MARIHLHLIQSCPVSAAALLLGLNLTYAHSLSRGIPSACGTASHKHSRPLVAGWWLRGLDREAQPEVGRSGKSSSLRAPPERGSAGSCTSMTYPQSAPGASQKSPRCNLCIPSQPNDSSQACQVALKKRKLVARSQRC